MTYSTYLNSGTNTIAEIANKSGPASDGNDIPTQIAAYKQALGGRYAAPGGENLPVDPTPENIRRLTAGGISIEAGGQGKWLPKGVGMPVIDKALMSMSKEAPSSTAGNPRTSGLLGSPLLPLTGGVDFADGSGRTASPQSAGQSLAQYATGNAAPGGPSSIEGVHPEFADRINAMVSQMPPEIRDKFQIISGFRDQNRQAEVNPGVTNSHHTQGMAVDTTTDPDVIAWINQHGATFGVGYPLKNDPKETNHLEPLENGQRVPPDQMAQWVSKYGGAGGRDTVIGGGQPPAGGRLVSSTPPVGQVEAGNINLNARPIVKNPDGSISTVRSMSFNENGKEVLIPTVAADGSGILSDQAAIDQYHKTGQFLGKFDTPANATAYAQQLHQQQAAQYANQPTTPAAIPAPGVADLSRAQQELAQNFARITMAATSDPRRFTNPEAWQKGVQQAELEFKMKNMALNEQKQALINMRTDAFTGVVQKIMKNPGDPGLVDEINNNPNLDGPMIENLNKLHDEKIKGTLAGDNKRFGSIYADTYKRIFLPDGDQNKIRDPSQILQMGVTPGADGRLALTDEGIDRLTKVLGETKTSIDKTAEGHEINGVLAYAKDKLTNEDALPGRKLNDPVGSRLYDTEFVQSFFSYYERALPPGSRVRNC